MMPVVWVSAVVKSAKDGGRSLDRKHSGRSGSSHKRCGGGGGSRKKTSRLFGRTSQGVG